MEGRRKGRSGARALIRGREGGRPYGSDKEARRVGGIDGRIDEVVG